MNFSLEIIVRWKCSTKNTSSLCDVFSLPIWNSIFKCSSWRDMLFSPTSKGCSWTCIQSKFTMFLYVYILMNIGPLSFLYVCSEYQKSSDVRIKIQFWWIHLNFFAIYIITKMLYRILIEAFILIYKLFQFENMRMYLFI